MIAIATAPQNWAMTGFDACERAVAVCRIQCTAQALVSATSRNAAQAPDHRRPDARRPGNWTGRVAAAPATMPVPMIDAYQFGPRFSKT